MAKRLLDNTGEQPQAAKKQKRKDDTSKTPIPRKVEVPEIKSADQLRQVLAYKSDEQVKAGLQSFKTFLQIFSDGGGGENEKSILRDFLESQRPKDEGGLFLAKLLDLWPKASQSNNLSLQSQIPAILASLLKTISFFLDFRPYGSLLCISVLEVAQLRVLARAMTSNREFLVNPCLRLLTEIVSFDGGRHAKAVYTQRELTFKRLGHNLGAANDGPAKKSSVRDHALGFLLANFQYQDAVVKEDLSKQTDVISALFKHIDTDSPAWIVRTLKCLRDNFIKDNAVQRYVKSRLLSPWVLSRIASIYGYKGQVDDVDPVETAHSFLLEVCTLPNIGLVVPGTSWYPHGMSSEKSSGNASIAVRNKNLASFIDKLKPWTGTKHSDLLIAIFRTAPELVAHYFMTSGFPFEPGQSSVWMGCSTILYSVVQLPVPLLEKSFPPPLEVCIQNILPAPVTEAVLIKSLRSKAELVPFFVMRLLIAAFEKLQQVRKVFLAASWTSAFERLQQAFIERIPPFKELVAVFRSTPDTDIMQKDAICGLMRLYFEMIPGLALTAKLDLSQALSLAAESALKSAEDAEQDKLKMSTLENLFALSIASPAMNWTAKAKGATYSPITSILRLVAATSSDVSKGTLLHQLEAPCCSIHLLQDETVVNPLEALVVSLKMSLLEKPQKAVLRFLDKVFSIFSQKSLAFRDELTSMFVDFAAKDFEGTVDVLPCSLLLVGLADQWPFFSKSDASEADKIEVASWLKRLYISAIAIGENHKVLIRLMSNIAKTEPQKKLRRALEMSWEDIEAFEEFPCAIEASLAPKTNSDTHVDRLFEFPLIPAGLIDDKWLEALAHSTTEDTVLFSVAIALGVLRVAHSEAQSQSISQRMSLSVLLLQKATTCIGTISSPLIRSRLKRLVCQGRMHHMEEEAFLWGSQAITASLVQVWQQMVLLLEALFSDLENLDLLNGYIDSLGDLLASVEEEENLPYIDTILNCTERMLPFCDEDHEELLIHNLPSPQGPQTVKFLTRYLGGLRKTTLRPKIWTHLSLAALSPSEPDLQTDVLATKLASLCSIDTALADLWDKEYLRWIISQVNKGNYPVQVLSAPFKGRPIDTPETCGVLFQTVQALAEKKDDASLRLFSALLGKLLVEKDDHFPQLAESQVELFSLLHATFQTLESHVLGPSIKHGGVIGYVETLYQASCIGIVSPDFKIKLICKLPSFFSPGQFSSMLLLLLGSILDPNADEKILRAWYLAIFPFLTRRFSSDEGPSESDTELIVTFTATVKRGAAFAPIHIDRLVPKTTLVPLLVSALRCKFQTSQNYAFVARLLPGLDLKNLDHGKIMGEALHNPIAALQAGTSELDRLVHAFILHQLFSASPAHHSNVSTITQLLSFYRGTTTLTDRLLLGIFKHFSASAGISCYDLISSFALSSTQEPFLRLTGGKLSLFLSPEMIAASLADLQPMPDTSILSFENSMNFEGSAVYDLGFLIPLTIYCLNSDKISMDVSVVVEKQLASVMLYALSTELRETATTALLHFIEKLKMSKYQEAPQLLLLVQETIETAKTSQGRLPPVLGAFAAKAAEVLANPLHFLYGKINHFLNQGPTWDLDKIPLLRKIFASQPDEDDGYYKEIAWIIDVLQLGLRESEDVSLYHRSGAFELLLTHYSSPYLSPQLRGKILDVLDTAARLSGGCSILSEKLAFHTWLYQHRDAPLEVSQTSISSLAEEVQKHTANTNHDLSHTLLTKLVQDIHM